RAPPAPGRRGARRTRRALSPRAAPHVRDTSPRGRRRPAQHPAPARPRIGGDDPGVHPRERPPPAGRPRQGPPPRMTDEPTDIWAEYKRTGERRLRDRLILTYAPLVKYV